jgi:hypothetical protein
MLCCHPVGLLLHRGVEEQHSEHADSEDDEQAGGERDLAPAWRRRTRAHPCSASATAGESATSPTMTERT